MSGRFKVLYICFDTIPSPKGASTHVTYFVKALVERYEVTLMSVGTATSPAEAIYCGARHVAAPLNQPNLLDRALAFRETVWDELEDNRYDLVHFRTMWAALPIAEEKKRQGFKVICEVNGVDSIELKYHYPVLRAYRSLLEKLRAQERLAFETADVFITPSQVTKRYLMRQGVPVEKAVVIPNGVDVDLFQSALTPASSPKALGEGSADEGEAGRQSELSPLPQRGRGGRENDRPVGGQEEAPRGEGLTVLYVGTLTPWQGVDFLLDAMKRVRVQRPMRLRILGVGRRAWMKALNKRIRKLGLEEHVEFLPSVPHEQVPAVVHAADICVAPLAPTERNLVQGCHPVKILEYMACGKPIVAANLPVVREILTHEEDALLHKVDKPSRLARCLLRLADDSKLRQRLGGNALRKAREQFSWQRAQQSLTQVYARLLAPCQWVNGVMSS